MKKLKTVLVLGAAAGLIGGISHLEANAPRTASLAMVKSDVKVQQPGSATWVAASKGMPLYEGSSIKTGAGSTAILRLDDGSMTKIAPLSVFKIQSMSAAGAKKNTKLGMNLGKTWNRVNKLRDASDFKMDTPSAVAGIRGTYFGSEVNRGADADYDFWEGEGLVTAKADGSSIAVKANQGVSVGSGKAVGELRSARDAGDGIDAGAAQRYQFDLDIKVSPEIPRANETAKVKIQLLRNGSAYPGRANFKVTLNGSAQFSEGGQTIEVSSNDQGYAELDITSDKEEKVSVEVQVALPVGQ
jgi:hypothetical protein